MSNQTYFVRHTLKLGADDDTLRQLWESDTIAIHFPQIKGKIRQFDNDSLELKTYTGSGLKAMKVLKELADKGGYVAAEYTGYGRIIGKIEPNSTIQLLEGKWREFDGLTKLRPKGYPAVLKTLTLKQPRKLEDNEQISVFAGRPQQGTISRWPNARMVICDLVDGNPRAQDWRSLSPQQQEILCSEFMRMPESDTLGLPRLEHLILPVGSTLKDIDIAGIGANGQRIYAQVTHRSYSDAKTQGKLVSLSKYKDGQLILFCDCDRPQAANSVWLCPISSVFDLFLETGFGKRWLELALQ